MKDTNHAKLLIFIAIPVFCILIILFSVQWWCINDNITQIKRQNEAAYQKIATAKKNGAFKIEYSRLNKKQVLIDPKEISKINEHIDYLAEEVHKESNRAESIIDKDLDRLNLYMAVGIGFMTLLGIFVPLLINVLSVQDLKEKQKLILTKFEEVGPKITSAIESANTAITSSSSALEKSQQVDGLVIKIDNLETTASSIAPQLYNLILQNAIARFFNVSSIVLANAYRTNSYQDFVKLLEAIKTAFTVCKLQDAHTIEGNESFEHTISDFILFLETERFRFQSVFNTRTENHEFQKLIDVLQVLKSSTASNENINYENVINQLDTIGNIFSSRNAVVPV